MSECFVDRVPSAVLIGRPQVGVDAQRDAGIDVATRGRDRSHRDALGDERRRDGVAQIVEPSGMVSLSVRSHSVRVTRSGPGIPEVNRRSSSRAQQIWRDARPCESLGELVLRGFPTASK